MLASSTQVVSSPRAIAATMFAASCRSWSSSACRRSRGLCP